MLPETDSSVACSKLLLQLAGIELSEDISISSDKTTASNLKELSKTYGVHLKQKNLKITKLSEKELPLAFLGTDGSYRILAKMNKNECLIQHPFKQKSELWSVQELFNNWSGKVITLSDRSLKFNWSWFLGAFKQYKRNLCEVLYFSFMLQLLALILPLFFQIIMDKVIAYQAYKTLDVLIVGLLVTSTLEVLLKGVREYQYSHTTNRIDMLLGIKLVKQLLGLPLLYFKSRPVGSLVSRVLQLDTIRSFFK